MTARHAIFAFTVLVIAGTGPAAMAEEFWDWGHGGSWYAGRYAIYELNNGIAFLEADPEIDDGYKAPVVTRNRAGIRKVRATLPPAQWQWTSPCCYSRRPIYIR